MTGGRGTFELRRRSDDFVSTFDRVIREDGASAYKRRDCEFWITKRDGWGWVAWNDAASACFGRPWNALPCDQGDHSSEGDRVSRKGNRSYVYHLVYPS